jgi:hypothetical protein
MRTRPKTATEKLVLLSLADHHNQSTGRCDPSISRIADESLCSPRQVMRCIESLSIQGLIQPAKTIGKRSSYQLNLNVTRDTHVTRDVNVTSDTDVTTTRDTHVRGPVTPMSPEPVTNQEVNQEGIAREPKKPKSGKATKIPDGFCVTDDMRRWFVEKQVPGDPAEVTEHFLDHHRSKGSVFKDWDAAWRTWCRNQVKFQRGMANGNSGQRRLTPAERVYAANAERFGSPSR